MIKSQLIKMSSKKELFKNMKIHIFRKYIYDLYGNISCVKGDINIEMVNTDGTYMRYIINTNKIYRN